LFNKREGERERSVGRCLKEFEGESRAERRHFEIADDTNQEEEEEEG
jgi:hypothetical protein